MNVYARCCCLRFFTQVGKSLQITSIKDETVFLHSKDSHTKFTLATRNVKRMRAFARFKNEIWCMDFVYNDKLAKQRIGAKYSLVRPDLFDRIVNAKGKKI